MNIADIWKEKRESIPRRAPVYSLGKKLSPQLIEPFKAAQAAFIRGDFQTAIDNLCNCINIDPNFAFPFFSLGQVYEEQGNMEMAYRFYLQAAQKAPKWTHLWERTLVLGIQEKQYDGSLQAVEKINKVEPSFLLQVLRSRLSALSSDKAVVYSHVRFLLHQSRAPGSWDTSRWLVLGSTLHASGFHGLALQSYAWYLLSQLREHLTRKNHIDDALYKRFYATHLLEQQEDSVPATISLAGLMPHVTEPHFLFAAVINFVDLQLSLIDQRVDCAHALDDALFFLSECIQRTMHLPSGQAAVVPFPLLLLYAVCLLRKSSVTDSDFLYVRREAIPSVSRFLEEFALSKPRGAWMISHDKPGEQESTTFDQAEGNEEELHQFGVDSEEEEGAYTQAPHERAIAEFSTHRKERSLEHSQEYWKLLHRLNNWNLLLEEQYPCAWTLHDQETETTEPTPALSSPVNEIQQQYMCFCFLQIVRLANALRRHGIKKESSKMVQRLESVIVPIATHLSNSMDSQDGDKKTSPESSRFIVDLVAAVGDFHEEEGNNDSALQSFITVLSLQANHHHALQRFAFLCEAVRPDMVPISQPLLEIHVKQSIGAMYRQWVTSQISQNMEDQEESAPSAVWTSSWKDYMGIPSKENNSGVRRTVMEFAEFVVLTQQYCRMLWRCSIQGPSLVTSQASSVPLLDQYENRAMIDQWRGKAAQEIPSLSAESLQQRREALSMYCLCALPCVLAWFETQGVVVDCSELWFRAAYHTVAMTNSVQCSVKQLLGVRGSKYLSTDYMQQLVAQLSARDIDAQSKSSALVTYSPILLAVHLLLPVTELFCSFYLWYLMESLMAALALWTTVETQLQSPLMNPLSKLSNALRQARNQMDQELGQNGSIATTENDIRLFGEKEVLFHWQARTSFSVTWAKEILSSSGAGSVGPSDHSANSQRDVRARWHSRHEVLRRVIQKEKTSKSTYRDWDSYERLIEELLANPENIEAANALGQVVEAEAGATFSAFIEKEIPYSFIASPRTTVFTSTLAAYDAIHGKKRPTEALDLLENALLLDQSQPLLWLLMTTQLIRIATSKKTIESSSHVLIQKAFVCLVKYCQCRRIHGAEEGHILLLQQEIFYNIGRVCQEIGLYGYSEIFYRKGLEMTQTEAWQHHVTENLLVSNNVCTKVIAHNLVLLYKRSGSEALILQTMLQYLIVEE